MSSSPSIEPSSDGLARRRLRRIVIKAGTNVLTGGTDRLDLEVMASLAGQIGRLRKERREVVLVTSGAVAAGRRLLRGLKAHNGTAMRQALAAIGQSSLMHAYEQLFAWHDITVAQVLVTRSDVTDRLGYLNVRNTFTNLLSLGVVPVVNENDVVGVEELAGDTFGDNDTLSALVANLVDADLLVILSDVGGLYTADPHKDPDARLIAKVDRVDGSIEDLAGRHDDSRSRGGMTTKLQAARTATSSGVAVVIANGWERDVVPRLVKGELLGTYFPPAASKLQSRRRWMVSALINNGEIVVDAGAVDALRRRHRSLLPAGVAEVRGTFSRGEVVPIVGLNGERIACGIVNYSSADLTRIKGIRTDRIREVLDGANDDEVVHRNNLAPL